MFLQESFLSSSDSIARNISYGAPDVASGVWGAGVPQLAIRHAAFIIVLDEGHVRERGTHEQLFAAGGRYWSLLRRQQLEESLESAPASLAEAGRRDKFDP